MALSKITTGSLADAAITTDKIANSAINSAKIGVDVITAEDLAANSITVAEITNGAVTPAKLSTGGLYWDASSNVGIGTTSPANKLDVNGSLTLRPYYATYLANSYYSGSWKYIDNGAAWGIGDNFGGPSNGVTIAQAAVNSSGANAALTWLPRLNINSSGNVGIGGTVDNHGGYARCLQVTGTEAALELESSSGYSYVAQNGTSLQIRNVANGDMPFYTNNTERMRILSSGGITFNGDTAAANALDDYEEGTWTPTASPSSGSYNGLTTGGWYVKIGRSVTVFAYWKLTASGDAGGNWNIGGLPFTCLNTGSFGAGNRGALMIGREDAVTGLVYQMFWNNNTTSGQIQNYSGGNPLWTTGYIYIMSGTYETAS